ncbi:FGGY-family carbohydrate kinase [Pseudoflavonifractor sp. An85]|uniref:xylulokinase n=1 Tax=Pseudoflavonifractor sp. An85 TaxID=1965661 RepID=UPI000B3AFBC0|nr:FGGY-family carbohydrate kinase [Pseudoflavonifractor sp. An85]OUN21050.1 ATPase [Pseudoflavonifractor sp. An85]
MNIPSMISAGEACLGIELGSTRIKAVLIGPDHAPIASGDHSWENRYEGGYWTYSMEDVWTGLQEAYANLSADVGTRYGVKLTRVASMGFSAMMHGYLPLNAQGELLAPFRTWRNTTTGPAAQALSQRFHFNIPQRWSIAHLYQAILNGEEHVSDIAILTTLAGYVHWKLTGSNVLGVGDASGVFPIDSNTCDYDQTMVDSFDELVSDKGYPWKLRDILPQVATAGAHAGVLTPEGAKLLDPTGNLQPGAIFCPPEGDAGTGMAATNAVAKRTGNVSAGTSVFAMIVLEKALKDMYEEIDMVTTPDGAPVAMVHCNNCTNEINAWANVFEGLLTALGHEVDKNALYTAMFTKALEGKADCDGLLLYNYLSGEPVTGLSDGRPLLVRGPEAKLNFANFMRTQLYSALATLKVGLDILAKEQVKVDRLMGHGGFFKTPVVGQRIMAAAANSPVAVMETAGEGGPWGMALLAAYAVHKAEGQSLQDYLDTQVFGDQKVSVVEPVAEDVEGFANFMVHYKAGLAVERSAVEHV